MRIGAVTPLFLVLATAAAQDGREPLRGSAMREDGTPWVGATVHLLSRPLANDERVGTADVVDATTDEKGRFLVQLLPGRRYVAWAVEDLTEDRYRASFAREDVMAGRPLDLVADAPRPRCLQPFEGLAPWRAVGRVVATLITATTPAIVVEHELTADSWLLPPLPCRQVRIEVVCDGQPLTQWPADIDLRQARSEPWQAEPPRRIRIRVVDAGGKPVARAEIATASLGFGDVRLTDKVVGTTGDDGMATVALPLPIGKRFAWANYAIAVRAPGFAPVGNISTVDIPADYDVSRSAAIVVALETGVRHSLRLHVGERAFARPVVLSTQPTTSGSGGRLTVPDPHRVVTADGSGTLEVLRHPASPAVLLAPVADLPRPDLGRVPLHPMALIAVIADDDTEPKLDIDLASLVPLVASITRDGAPVPGANVALLSGRGRDAERVVTGVLADRTGRTAVITPPATELTLVAWTNDAVGILRGVHVARDGAKCTLELRPMRQIAGRVTGRDGRPAAFVRVGCSIFGDDGGELAEIAEAMGPLRSDTRADGTFVLPMIDGLRCSLAGVTTPDDTHYVDRSWTSGRDDPELLEIDLSKSR